MLEIFESFANKNMFSSRFQDPYAVSHPMPQERIALLERIAKASPSYNAPDKPDLVRRHALARAKALAFMRDAGAVQRAYPLSDHSLAARYARAISAYRFGAVDAAQKDIDSLIAEKPNDPYFWELKGQALLEAGRARPAIAPLRKAVSLDPGAALIRILLAQAMVATNDKSLLDSAMSELRQALVHERDSSDAYRQLAIIYGRKNLLPQADVASAQAAFIDGRYKTAREFAERAKKGLPVGSPAWLRADDIATYKSASLKK
jgi:predicted Zn-dependent protease